MKGYPDLSRTLIRIVDGMSCCWFPRLIVRSTQKAVKTVF